MTQKFYTDTNGNYLGSYDGGGANPFGSSAVEVSSPPADANIQTWDGSAWTPSDSICAKHQELATLRGILSEVNEQLIDQGVFTPSGSVLDTYNRIKQLKAEI